MPNINPRIRSLDDLLGVARKVENTAATEDKPAQPGNNEIQMLPPEIIRGFRGHPFRLYEGDRFNDLVDSVSENGVLSPTIIRKIEPDENGFEYEMLAGHNRQNAAIAAKRLLPCIVKENLSDQDAWIYVIETNVLQRSFSEMFPSERAAVLALRYSKMICQGRRNDIIEELKRLENPDEIRENKTCGIDCHKSKSRDVVGAEYNLKGRAVANYLRINELSVALKIRIDDGEFTIAAAVQLSYLAQEEQQMVEAVLSESEYKVNEGKAVLLREYTGKLTPERAEQILSGEFSRKPKKSTAAAFKVKPAIYKKYFTASISQKEFDSIVRLFTSKSIYAITHTSDFTLSDLGTKKQALFVILPDEKTTFYPIASLIVSQQYELLAEAADRRGGRLERRVNFLLDEFGNFTPISDMTNKLTVAAGRGMRYALYVQGFDQLKEKYSDNIANTIKGNCQIWAYLQSDDPETLREMSDKLGSYTTSSYQLSASNGRFTTPSSSQSVSLTERKLLNTDEVRRVKRPYQIITSRDHPAMMYAPDLSKWLFNQMLGMGDMEHNRKLREERENKRPIITDTKQEIALWNIWVYYQKDIMRRLAQQKNAGGGASDDD